MEELRLSFLIFGTCAIVGILVHGFWSIRKNAAKQEKQSYEPKEQWSNEDTEQLSDQALSREMVEPTVIDADIQFDVDDPLVNTEEADPSRGGQFDELGLGEVRVVGKNPQRDIGDSTDTDDVAEQVSGHASLEPEEEVQAEAPKIYASVVTQPKPEYQQPEKTKKPLTAGESNLPADMSPHGTGSDSEVDLPEPPLSLLKKEQVTKEQTVADQPVENKEKSENTDKQEKPSLAEQAKNLVRRKKAEAPTRKRREPRVADDQMAIDFDEPVEPVIQSDIEIEPDRKEPPAAKKEPLKGESPPASAPSTDGASPKQEVLVLNVKVPEDKPIPGSALLPMLLTLGFKFGDQDIFHRHVNSNGKGPVLFSLANMFKPGVFDIDNLENFTTQGVSLFMILPIEGDPHQVFNMMHNAARKIADEFSAQVLDGRRSALTKQSLQQYVEKIREFERQRMIAR